ASSQTSNSNNLHPIPKRTDGTHTKDALVLSSTTHKRSQRPSRRAYIALSRRHSRYAWHHRRSPLRHRLAKGQEPQLAKATLPAPPALEKWIGWGAWYEAHGYYNHAAAAYE